MKRIVPATSFCANAVEQLHHEIAALSPFLQHPCLLPIYGLTTRGSTVHVVSRLCHGGSVKRAVRKLATESGAVLPLAKIFSIARGAVSALAFLHAANPPIGVLAGCVRASPAAALRVRAPLV